MAIQTIYLGTYANDGTGDDLRVAFEKVNANFTEIDSLSISNAVNLGAGVGLFAGKQATPQLGDNLTFKSLLAGSNVTLVPSGTTVTISSQFNSLISNLDLNSQSITGTGSISINGNITAVGGNVLVGNNLTVNGETNLGPVGRVTITGGATNYVLSTDGQGNLAWASPSGSVDWEFADFDNIASTPIQYLLSASDIDMGTVLSPNPIVIDLGNI